MDRDVQALLQTPRHTTPASAYLYLSSSHQRALTALTYGIQERQSSVAIFGEAGTGKTTLLRAYRERLNRQEITTIYITNPQVSFQGLLKFMCGDLGLTVGDADTATLLNRLQQVLRQEHESGRTVVLIIDEAQAMPTETLAQLPLLCSLESATQQALQMVFAGQPAFQHRLHEAALQSLDQHIPIRATITPLTRQESLAYLQHRLAQTTPGEGPMFTPAAMHYMVRHAQGIPGVLNALCTHTLATGLAAHKRPLTKRFVRHAVADFIDTRPRSCWPIVATLAAALALMSGVLWLGLRHTMVSEQPITPRRVHEQVMPAPTDPPDDVTLQRPVVPTPADTASHPEALRADVQSQGSTTLSETLLAEPGAQPEDRSTASVADDDRATLREGPDTSSQAPVKSAVVAAPVGTQYAPAPPAKRRHRARSTRPPQESLDTDAMTALLTKLSTPRSVNATKNRSARVRSRPTQRVRWRPSQARSASRESRSSFSSSSHPGSDSSP